MSERSDDKWAAGEAVRAAELIDVQAGGVVSRTIIKKKTGTVTVFAFDAGEGLSEHTTPYEALLMSLDGDAQITISGKPHHLNSGDTVRLPAGEPHAVAAVTPFKMMLIMIRE
jgi:quercetin dioxygenase-like cupin family protein